MKPPGYYTPVIEIRPGDTLSYGGRISLPAGNWSAICSFSDKRSPLGSTVRYDIDVSLSLVGPDPSNTSRNLWAITLTADSLATASWPSPPPNASYVEFPAAIKFFDDSTPPVTRTSESFNVLIKPQILP